LTEEDKRVALVQILARTRKAILNIASFGKFSGDRTIAEYASEIWGRGRARCRRRKAFLPNVVGEVTAQRLPFADSAKGRKIDACGPATVA
jgi:hypothetical protein